jgi:hypothetical protein
LIDSTTVLELSQADAAALWTATADIACSTVVVKIAEADAAVSVNKKKWLVMHMQLKLDELGAVAFGLMHGY